MSPTPETHPRRWRPRRPTAVGLIISIFRRGGGDPTFQPDRGDGLVAGPADARRARRRCGWSSASDLGEVVATAWGDGAAVGARRRCRRCSARATTTSGFVAHHPQVASAPDAVCRVARPALRPGPARAGAGGDRAEGHRPGGLRRLPHAGPPVRVAGARARRGSAGCGSRPTPRAWAAIPSWEWLARLGRRRPVRHRGAGGAGGGTARGVRRPAARRRRSAGCARCRASASGRPPRWPSGPSATPTR